MHTSQNSLIGIVGAPNSGKTTLFNWITGSKFRAVNYPGSTVESYTGNSLNQYRTPAEIIDTPGVYSLFPKSPDEEVTHRILFQEKKVQKLIVVVDATQMARHLYIVQQIKESGYPFVIAITMNDLIKKEKLEINAKILSQKIEAPVILIDGVLGGGIQQLMEAVQKLPPSQNEIRNLIDWELDKINFIHHQNESLISEVLQKNKLSIYKKTAQIDSILLHPLWGYVIFASVMATLFSSIFWMAAPFMDTIDSGFSTLAELATKNISSPLIASLISDGLISSLAAVFVFVPQIFILFFIIGLLEDSGYLARASTLIDKPFSKVGMNGRAFVPVLSGFACAIPALMAARTLGSKKERWITQFIIPLMTCSARLPVYALFLSFLFHGSSALIPGIALTGLYIFALLLGMGVASILNQFMKKEGHSIFMMELPIYRIPKFRVILKSSMLRTKSYVLRAGPIIFVLAALIWAASTFPHSEIEDSGQRLEQSYLGQVGQTIEPIFTPMGIDWKAGIGLMTAFAAREVFVSTLAVMYHISEDEDESTIQENLLSKMKNATMTDGSPIFTTSTIIGLILFFMISLQCMTTVATAARESGSWKFAIFQLLSLNLAAYLLAVGTVQGLRLIGIA